MMRKMLVNLKKHGIIGVANLLAFMTMAGSVNAACLWIHHQPKMPEEARKFRRF